MSGSRGAPEAAASARMMRSTAREHALAHCRVEGADVEEQLGLVGDDVAGGAGVHRADGDDGDIGAADLARHDRLQPQHRRGRHHDRVDGSPRAATRAPPRPCRTTRSASVAAKAGPDRRPIDSCGERVPRAGRARHPAVPKRSKSPSSIIAVGPAVPASSAGWRTTTTGARPRRRARRPGCGARAQQAGDMHVVPARMHDRHVGCRQRSGPAHGSHREVPWPPPQGGRPCRHGAARRARRRCGGLRRPRSRRSPC